MNDKCKEALTLQASSSNCWSHRWEGTSDPQLLQELERLQLQFVDVWESHDPKARIALDLAGLHRQAWNTLKWILNDIYPYRPGRGVQERGCPGFTLHSSRKEEIKMCLAAVNTRGAPIRGRQNRDPTSQSKVKWESLSNEIKSC